MFGKPVGRRRSSRKSDQIVRRTGGEAGRASIESLETRALLSAAVEHVIHVSVDGLRPDAITQLGQSQLPNFYRLRNEGAFTDNARTDFDYSITMPNHATQMTGYPVVSPNGHKVTFNEDNGGTIHQTAGHYVPSAFDVAHDHGRRTALYAGKSKFAFYDRSWNGTNGAPDVTGVDNGQDKIDTYYFTQDSVALTSRFVADMKANPFAYTMFHFHDPDTVGHANGWMTTAYLNAVKLVDQQLGEMFKLIDTDARFTGKTAVLLTADHGGEGPTHTDAGNRLNYTIPFYAWGAGASAGTDLYQINAATRTNPGTGRPDHLADPQPIRNGDTANVSLDLLGLGPVPGSRFDARQDLALSRADAVPFTVAVIPDTQYYTQSYPQTFHAQTQWIADRVMGENIAFVSHVGDLVENAAAGTDRNLTEWTHADAAMDRLDGLVPYSVAIGNHDYDVLDDHASATRFTEFFGGSRYAGRSWYGGASAGQRNHYQFFSAGGRQFLHITIEWEAPDSAIAWAQSVLDAHPNVPTILTTHAYVQASSGRATYQVTPDGNTGEEIYQKLVRNNSEIFMVLNGHYPGESHQVSTNAAAQPVFEMLSNYQDRANGGDGWLRTVTFHPHENRIDVKTYSPTLGLYETDADSQFSFNFDFNKRFNFAGAPTATLVTPADNGPLDGDPAVGSVRASGNQASFRVQLADAGGSVDDASVTAATVRVVKDGASFTGYGFAYDAGTDAITLTPASEASFTAGTYEIFVGDGGAPIRDAQGNAMAATRLKVQITTSSAGQLTATFQQNVGQYAGTRDTQLAENTPTTSYATAASLNVDTDDPSGTNRKVQALLRYENLFGTGAGQIPTTAASIDSAFLELRVTDGGTGMNLHRMVQTWADTATWNSMTTGIQTNDVEARTAFDASTGAVPIGTLRVDVTASLRAWLANPSSIHGWAILSKGTDGIDFDSAEGATAPKLTVQYTASTSPTATADAYATNEDTTLTVDGPGVLANDTDPEGQALSAVLVNQPSFGRVVLNPDGSFTYTPNADLYGTDYFTYQASDGTSASAPTTVAVTVNPVNDAPVAANDAYTVNENTTLAGNVVDNDTDADADDIGVEILAAPEHGQLVIDAHGAFTYTPNEGYTGTDSFTYVATDEAGAASSPATVSITVEDVNDAPVAAGESYGVSEDGLLTVAADAGVLANDRDADGPEGLTAQLTVGPAHGVVGLNADGSFVYTPDADYAGPDGFEYRAYDGINLSAPQWVVINVAPVNDAPVAADDAVSTDRGVAVAVAVLANDSDADGDPLVVSSFTQPANGVVTVGADGSLTYTPADGFVGTDTFGYTVSDGAATDDAVVTVRVNQPNQAPVAADDVDATDEDTPLFSMVPVLANDSDPEGAPMTAVLENTVQHGTLVLNADGSFTYTPDANFSGTDAFTYRAGDGGATSNLATVTITVHAVNDAPTASDDAYLVNEDGTLMVAAAQGVLVNDADVENDALTAMLVGGPANGSLTLNADGTFTYTPNANFNGIDSFTYRASDGAGASAVATVTISVSAVTDAPVAHADAYSVAAGATLNVGAATGVLANDADVDGNPLTARLAGTTTNGTLTLNDDGSFGYKPRPGFIGTDSFSYYASDGEVDSAPVTVTIEVKGTSPVAPSQLSASVKSSSRIDLTWKDNSTNETGFRIEYSLDGGANWLVLTTRAANAKNYSATGLIANTQYMFRVIAFNAAGDSAASNVVTAKTRA